MVAAKRPLAHITGGPEWPGRAKTGVGVVKL